MKKNYELLTKYCDVGSGLVKTGFFENSETEKLTAQKSDKEWKEYLADFRKVIANGREMCIRLEDVYYAFDLKTPDFVKNEMYKLCMDALKKDMFPKNNFRESTFIDTICFLLCSNRMSHEDLIAIKDSDSVTDSFKLNCIATKDSEMFTQTAYDNLSDILSFEVENSSFFDKPVWTILNRDNEKLENLLIKYKDKLSAYDFTEIINDEKTFPQLQIDLFSINCAYSALKFPLAYEVEQLVAQSALEVLNIPKDELPSSGCLNTAIRVISDIIEGHSFYGRILLEKICEDFKSEHSSKELVNSCKKILYTVSGSEKCDFETANILCKILPNTDLASRAITNPSLFIKELKPNECKLLNEYVNQIIDRLFKGLSYPVTNENIKWLNFRQDQIFLINVLEGDTSLEKDIYSKILNEEYKEYLKPMAMNKITPKWVNDKLKEKNEDLKLIVLLKEKMMKEYEKNYNPLELEKVVDCIFKFKHIPDGKNIEITDISPAFYYQILRTKMVKILKELSKEMNGTSYCKNQKNGMLVKFTKATETFFSNQSDFLISLDLLYEPVGVFHDIIKNVDTDIIHKVDCFENEMLDAYKRLKSLNSPQPRLLYLSKYAVPNISQKDMLARNIAKEINLSYYVSPLASLGIHLCLSNSVDILEKIEKLNFSFVKKEVKEFGFDNSEFNKENNGKITKDKEIIKNEEER